PIFIWAVMLGALGIIVAGLIFTRSLTEAKRIEFLIFAIAALVNAAFAFLSGVYALLARRFQSVIAGQVNLNNKPATYAEVTLLRPYVTPNILLRRRDELKQGGRYYFHMSMSTWSATYQVVAKN